MSSGPTLTGGANKFQCHLNLRLSIKDWCRKYEENKEFCQIENNWDRSLCLYCEHRRPLDIQRMLENCRKERQCG